MGCQECRKNSPLPPSSGLSVEMKQIPVMEPISSQEGLSFTLHRATLQIKTDDKTGHLI